MKTRKSLLIKGLTVTLVILSFVIKALYPPKKRYPLETRWTLDINNYTTTIIDVIDAGKNVGITVLASINSFKNCRMSPEETLEIAEKLTSNKRNVDKALNTLIKDLKDYAIEKTEDGKLNA